MDVLSTFDNILYQYISTVGLKPILVTNVVEPEVPTPPRKRNNYVRAPEPPSSMEYSVDKLGTATKILSKVSLPSRPTQYVKGDDYVRIDLDKLIT